MSSRASNKKIPRRKEIFSDDSDSSDSNDSSTEESPKVVKRKYVAKSVTKVDKKPAIKKIAAPSIRNDVYKIFTSETNEDDDSSSSEDVLPKKNSIHRVTISGNFPKKVSVSGTLPKNVTTSRAAPVRVNAPKAVAKKTTSSRVPYKTEDYDSNDDNAGVLKKRPGVNKVPSSNAARYQPVTSPKNIKREELVLVDNLNISVSVGKRVNNISGLHSLIKKLDDEQFIDSYKENILKILSAKLSILTKSSTRDTKMIRKLDTPPDDKDLVRGLISEIKAGDYDLVEAMKTAIYDPKYGLSSIIGMEEVKDYLAIQIMCIASSYKYYLKRFNNIILIGRPGSGKTTIAKVIAYFYSLCCVICQNRFTQLTPNDFTSMFAGDSSAKTRKHLSQSIAGIVIVDEANGFAIERSDMLGPKSTNLEIINEMVAFMDEYKGYSNVIMMGYEEEMKKFIKINPGLARRMPHIFRTEDYSSKQLATFLIGFLDDSDLKISKKDINTIYTIVDSLNQKDLFKNQGGDMYNIASNIMQYKILFDDDYIVNGFNLFLSTIHKHIAIQKTVDRIFSPIYDDLL